jgi:hypothetical protein
MSTVSGTLISIPHCVSFDTSTLKRNFLSGQGSFLSSGYVGRNWFGSDKSHKGIHQYE